MQPVRRHDVDAAILFSDIVVPLRAAGVDLDIVAGNLSASSLFDAAEILERVGAEARLDAADAAWRRLSMAASEVLTTLRQHETHYSR